MKKLSFIAKSLLAGTMIFSLAACNNTKEDAAGTAATTTAADPATLPNIRYIDSDTVSAYYNLAKELQENALRSMSRIENTRQSKATEIQKLAAQIEQKARTNSYLTEESYNGDMARLQKMNQDAEAHMANLQRTFDTELVQQQQVLSDSLESFIKDYCAQKGYDAILFRAAGIYFNPALDVTQEVIEGLNARYKKKDEK